MISTALLWQGSVSTAHIGEASQNFHQGDTKTLLYVVQVLPQYGTVWHSNSTLSTVAQQQQ